MAQVSILEHLKPVQQNSTKKQSRLRQNYGSSGLRRRKALGKTCS